MVADPNPLAGIENIQFSRHATFVMKERGTSAAEIVQDIKSPNADVSVDRKTGHFIIRKGLSRIVVKKGNESNAKVITVFTNDGSQGQNAQRS